MTTLCKVQRSAVFFAVLVCYFASAQELKKRANEEIVTPREISNDLRDIGSADTSSSSSKGKGGKGGGSSSNSKSGKGGKGKGSTKSSKSNSKEKSKSCKKSKGKGGKGKGGSSGSSSKSGKGGSYSSSASKSGKGKGKGGGSFKSSTGCLDDEPSTTPSTSPSMPPTESSAPSKFPSSAPVGVPTPAGVPSFTPTISTLPTNGPSSHPSTQPSYPCGVDPLTRRDMIFNILAPVVTPAAEINDVGSSANLAFEWLVEQDGYFICPDDPKLIQRYVMGKIYFQMNGDGWLQCSRPSSSNDPTPTCDAPQNQGYEGAEWLDAANECDWAFVKCDSNKCITHIEVDENLVTGTLVNEIDWLKDLQVYTMDGDPNQIVGTIPTQFGNLTDLRILDLDENALTGTIPEEIYSTSAELEELDFDSNQLTGTISTLIGGLTSLNFLQLFSNPMVGTIPTEIGNLEQLTTLGLYNMDLTGSVPDEICDNVAPAGSIVYLWTDCGSDATNSPQVVCDCCNFCFIG